MRMTGGRQAVPIRVATLLIAGAVLSPPAFAAADPGPEGPAAPSPFVLDDLVRLLEAGFGQGLLVRQIHRAGIDFRPGVEALLRLKEAGAGEQLLAAVLDSGVGEGVTGSDDVRIFTGRDGRGQPVMVLTNLDDSGRRIGGELPSSAGRSIVSSPTRPASEPRTHARDTAPPPPPQPPAVVVVRDPPPPPPPAPEPRPCGGCAFGAVGCNVIATGGLVGGFRYPDKLYFLGYGPSSAPISPSFGGVPRRIGGPASFRTAPPRP